MNQSLQPMENAEPLVSELAIVLDEEFEAMLERDMDRLGALVGQKHQMLEQLARLEPELMQSLSAGERTAEQNRMLDALRECYERNRRNQVAALTGMRHARKALMTLRSILQLQDLELYDEDGDLQVSRVQRYLGAA